jgi:NTP pyrophosphatase (non-canonical NTP hydrolase)
MLSLQDYQVKAMETAVYPRQYAIMYPALGLCGEAGEVAEKVKKLFRDANGVMSEARREEIKKELGDVLWYLAVLSFDIGLNLGDIGEANLAKLASRKERGVLKGSGDNR